jgi:methionyl aminopeptidase
VVILKSRDEVATMRRAGRVVAHTLERVVAAVRPGVRLRELDQLGARAIAASPPPRSRPACACRSTR